MPMEPMVDRSKQYIYNNCYIDFLGVVSIPLFMIKKRNSFKNQT